jgi:UDP-N-acetylmuramoyl-tripeptide--D-alanyl-D-alanine ligase
MLREAIAKLSHQVEVVQGLPPAKGVSFHSSRTRPGDVFFALPGAARHGMAFADAALAAGAAFIVSDQPHPQGVVVDDPAALLLALGRHARQQLRGPVVGVTGSAGKSSTKAFLAAALAARSSPGNFNTPLALAQVLVDAWLAEAEEEARPLVLELGIDHVGEMDVLVSLAQPSCGVLTLVAESHLSGLGNLASVAREKSKLIDAVELGFVSSQVVPFLSSAQRAKCVSYGLAGEAADHHVTRIEQTSTAQTLELFGHRLTLPYLGEAMARNALAAVCVARHFGVAVHEAAERVATARLEPGRLQVTRFGNVTLIDDSYNSNPASAHEALALLARFPRPHTAVLGDMLELGDVSADRHRQLGEATRELACVIAIGGQAQHVREGNPHAMTFANLEAAAATLQTLPLEGTILVKGSRGIGLERAVALLRERLAAPEVSA